MKRTFYITLFSLLLIGISSCKKNDLPMEEEGAPTVWVEGKLNGIPFRYDAGTNASYGAVVIHDIDAQSRQYIFRINAPELNKSFEVSINNASWTLGDKREDLEKTIIPGSYNFIYSNTFPNIPYRVSEIILAYIDHSTGSKFYTVPYNQNLVGAEFKILSVSDKTYEGKHYKMAEISFHCRVKNPSNGTWYDITDGHGFIPFGE